MWNLDLFSGFVARVHYKHRLVCSLVVMLLVFVLTCVFVEINTSSCERSRW